MKFEKVKRTCSLLLATAVVGYSVFPGTSVNAQELAESEVNTPSVQEAEKTFGDYSYEESSDGTLTITRYGGSDTELVIPGQIDGKSVTSIGSGAFFDCRELTSVSIPEGVTSIGYSAFRSCSGLTSVSIPRSVTSIEESAFGGCGRLESVSIPEGVTYIAGYAFSGCSRLESITISEGVTSIGAYAFHYCSGLTSVSVPRSVTSIGTGAFWGCSGLESMKVEEGNEVYDSRGNCNAIIEKRYISDTLIFGCKNTVIPEGVTDIETSAFNDCSGLTSISIPGNVTHIGAYAFSGCSGLTSVSIQEGVTSIGASAFSGCSGLTSVSIREGVTSIGAFAFSGCSGLTSITIPGSVTSIGDAAFEGCSGLTSLIIPGSVMRIENSTFEGCSGLASVIIQESVKGIGSSAFWGCSGLTSVSIPGSVMGIGTCAFEGCSGLTSVSIPEGVVYIGDGAFEGCSGLTSVSIPRSVTRMGDVVFKDCSGLESMKVEEENEAFDSRGNCNAIIETESNTLVSGCKNTIIPGSVTRIGDWAFSGCSGLEDITIPEGVTSIEPHAFWGCSGLANITIPENVTYIGNSVFTDCSEELTIYGTTGSCAEEYAAQNHIKFSAVEAAKPSGKKTLSDSNVSLSQTSYAYDGKAKTPAVTVKDGSKTLTRGTDYTVDYKNNVNAGTAKAVVTGKGNYTGSVTKTFTITVKNGTSHTVGAYKYQVTGTSAVSIMGVSKANTTKVKVPKTVKIGGKTFNVTAIGKNAFKKNKKITSVEIGDNVAVIGVSAFEGCAKLGKVTVGKGITEIGAGAFKGCAKLGTITIKSMKLKKVGKNALKGIKTTAKVKVPAKKLVAYQRLLKNKGQGKKVKIVK